MRVLVTGGAGRLGRYVADELSASHDVVLFDVMAPEGVREATKTGDVRTPEPVREAMENCDAVIHLAGIPVLTPEHRQIWDVNATGTLNVLECMVTTKVRRIAFASSICAQGFINAAQPMPVDEFPVTESYPGQPEDIYGLAKRAGEMLCASYTQRYGLEAVSLRLATICYPKTDSVARLRRRGSEQGTRFIWNYVDARDAAAAFRLAVEKPVNGHEIYNIGAGDTCSPTPTAELVQRLYPGSPSLASGFPGSDHDPLWSIDKARQRLGYQPRHSWRDYPIET